MGYIFCIKLHVAALLLCLFVLFPTPGHTLAAANINDIDFMTEQYPPFNYIHNGTLKGISVEILDLVFKELNATVSVNDVRHLPWARAYKTALHVPDSCLFVMTRSGFRENLFKWAGPVMPTTIAVIARKDRNMRVPDAQALNAYTIAALHDDIGHSLLINAGYPEKRIATNPYASSIIEMLNKRRVDAWAYEESVARYFIREAGYNPDDYETVFTLESSELYFAFNISTPDAIIHDFQNALDVLRERGEVESIIRRYVR